MIYRGSLINTKEQVYTSYKTNGVSYDIQQRIRNNAVAENERASIRASEVVSYTCL